MNDPKPNNVAVSVAVKSLGEKTSHACDGWLGKYNVFSFVDVQNSMPEK